MKASYRRLLLTLFSCALLPWSSLASSGPETSPQVFGWVERAIVLPVDAAVRVKLDSGALTSSMHAKDIESFTRNGKKWVRFSLRLEDKVTGEEVESQLEKPVRRYARIRGAGGQERRPVVVLPVCIGDRVLREEFTLNDREDMLYPVLVGRRTLKQLGLIDVSATYLNKPSCDNPSSES